jgi:hypothetical protein
MATILARVPTTTLVAATFLGCASGQVTGGVSTPGQSPAPLTMTWESGIFGERGTMTAVMPDGERFKGTYQVVKKGMSLTKIPPEWNESGAEAKADIADRNFGAADQERFVREHLNKAIATLKGNRGTSMLCRFNLNAGESGMRGGGSGECQTSRGARITAQF